jgi:hypothetical protein
VADVVEIVMALRNVRQFVSGAEAASKAMGGVGTASERAGKQAGVGWKGVAKWAGGAAIVVGATKFVKGAVSATEDLAKSTMTLQRSTNLDTETASEWAALLKERGIATKQFQLSLVKLSKTMETSRSSGAKERQELARLRGEIDAVTKAGGKTAPAALDKLSRKIEAVQAKGAKGSAVLAQFGISQRDVAKGDTRTVLAKLADGFSKMENPAKRVALAQQLFGRSGQALLPILMKGAAGVDELLAQQKAYGNYLEGHSIEDTKKLIAQQREFKTAMQGVKVQLGTALLPVLVSVGKLIVFLTRASQPLTKNALLFKVVLIALAAAFAVYKIALLAATIAQTAFGVSLGLTAFWIALVVVAIVALGIGFVYLYKHSEKFRAAIDFLWHSIKVGFEWVKEHWPLLLAIMVGPFGVAALLIIRHFDKVKAFVLAVVGAIKQSFVDLLDFVKSIPDKIKSVAKHIPGYGLASKTLGGIAGRFADGGTVARAGGYLVGERGPEIVGLPRGASVTPAAVTAEVLGGGGGRPLELIVPVMLNDREIGRAVARVTADQLARR